MVNLHRPTNRRAAQARVEGAAAAAGAGAEDQAEERDEAAYV